MNEGEKPMDEQLQRKLLRQLKISNFFMGIVTFMVVLVFGVLGFLIWVVVSFTNDIRTRVENIQTKTEQTLDVRDQICNDPTGKRLFGNASFCQQDQPAQ